MTSLPSSSLIFGLAVVVFIISPAPAFSLTCTSQKFTNNATFANCTDLPTLRSFLHWTYNSANSSLSIAFLAPPAKSSGWISWGINPTAKVMLGTQALIAFKHSNGSMTVNTYDISSYAIAPSKIAFDVTGLRAENSGGLMKIFATLALPANTTEVFQVWQTGGSVTAGTPDKHDMMADNKNAMGLLKLVEEQRKSNSSSEISPVAAPQSSPGNGNVAAPQSSPGNGNGGISIGKQSNGVFYAFLLILGIFAMF